MFRDDLRTRPSAAMERITIAGPDGAHYHAFFQDGLEWPIYVPAEECAGGREAFPHGCFLVGDARQSIRLSLFLARGGRAAQFFHDQPPPRGWRISP